VKATAETKLFLSASEKVGFDKTHRKKINFNISKYDTAVAEGKKLYVNLNLARERAGYLKYKVVNDLDKYLIEFEDNFLKNGGKIIWARNTEEAVLEITKIIERKKSKLVVKSKSMTTEEIELNEALGKKEVEVVETDLGEFIVQQAGQKPYHIVTPAMHLSKEDVAALYHEKFQTEENLTPEELTLYTRKILREKFIHADVGITGANFLIADLGGIALTENEGNAFLSISFPKTPCSKEQK
jgi:L-lactate dehydrogenase complex protein LldF